MHLLTLLLAALLVAAPAAAQTRRILVYGDSNAWGWIPVIAGFPGTRHGDGVRWPGVMAAALGPAYAVVVDGLNGRSAEAPSAEGPGPECTLNAASGDFVKALVRELPLDLVIVMLGTNDVRSDFGRRPAAIVEGLLQMAFAVRRSAGMFATGYPAPRVLLIAPVALGDTSRTPMGAVYKDGAPEKSRLVARALMALAAQEGIDAFDANSAVAAPGIDGIHLDAQGHAALGAAVAARVRAMLASQP